MFQMYDAMLYVPADPMQQPWLPCAGGAPNLLPAQ